MKSRQKLKNLVKEDPVKRFWDTAVLVLFVGFVVTLFFNSWRWSAVLLFLETNVSFIGIYIRCSPDYKPPEDVEGIVPQEIKGLK